MDAIKMLLLLFFQKSLLCSHRFIFFSVHSRHVYSHESAMNVQLDKTRGKNTPWITRFCAVFFNKMSLAFSLPVLAMAFSPGQSSRNCGDI